MTAQSKGWRLPRISPLLGLVIAAILLALGAWLGSSLVTSPRITAIEAGPPEPSVITAEVEYRRVEQEIVTRGDVRAVRTAQVISSAIPRGASVAVISIPMPSQGETLEMGSVAAEISGRPVFLLTGSVPMYRPLGPGVTGPDVAQLQEGLRAAGHEIADPNQAFGDHTMAAVHNLYAEAGYQLADGVIPVGEIAFLPSFPVTVTRSIGQVGTMATDAQLVLAAGDLTVSATFSVRQRQLLTKGDPVVVSSEVLGGEISARVGDSTVTVEERQEGDALGTTVEIIPDSPLPSSWAGQGVRISVVTAASAGEVLAVPVGAVFMGPNASPEVLLVQAPESVPLRTSRIAVTVGAVGGGFAEIHADDESLRAGATVLLSAPPEP